MPPKKKNLDEKFVEEKMRLKKAEKDCPGGTVDQNPPASTGDVGSTPGLGRFHVLWATEAREPQLLEPLWAGSAPSVAARKAGLGTRVC